MKVLLKTDNVVMRDELSIHSVLSKITQSLIDYTLKKKEVKRLNSFGLHNGEFGLFLYLVLYNKKYPNRFIEEKIEKFVDELLFEWIEHPDCYTYCMGTSGILDLIHYCNYKSIYQIDMGGSVDFLEDYISRMMIEDINKGDYDFLHASLGPANYLLDKGVKLDFIEEFIDLLFDKSIKQNGMFKWSFFDIISKKITYNICLSHGMSSIIIFLSKAYKRNIRREKVYELMLGSIKYILSQKLDTTSDNLSIFPSISKDHNCSSSRLGWCYGDLGIAAALWNAGEAIASKHYCDIAIAIVQNAFNRKDLNINMIQDAGICHGAAGVTMMFQYFWEKMKLDEALILRNYWLSKTINMIPFDNGKLVISKWCNNSYDLLMGASGVGLVLLSSVTDDYSWKKFFMLS